MTPTNLIEYRRAISKKCWRNCQLTETMRPKFNQPKFTQANIRRFPSADIGVSGAVVSIAGLPAWPR